MVRIIVAGVLAITCLHAYAQKKQNDMVLFAVQGEPVSAEEFMYLYKKNHQLKEDFSQQKIQEYFDLFVNFKLKVKEAKSRGIDTTAAFIKEYNSYKEELKKPYLPEGKIIDSLVQITYQRLQEEVDVSHILINVKPDALPSDTLTAYNKAAEIKEKALAGEDFGSLAALYSEEPMARNTKGSLGYFTALQMVYQFEHAAYTSRKGDIVGPVRTRFGYHVLKIEDRKPARGEVEVSHIMIRTGGERDEVKSKNLVFEIYDQLKGGVAWDELCKQYSEDPGTKNNAGRLRPFGVRAMATVPEFDRVAFSLQKPGDVSDPFQTQYGWHIVKLERKIPLPPLEELTANLKGRVARDERTQVSRQALMGKLKTDFHLKENQSARTKTFALADSSLTKGKWKVAATYTFGKEELLSLNSKKVTVEDFVSHVKKNQKPSGQAPGKYIEQLYASFVEKLMNDELEKKIIKEHPDFQMLLKEYYEGILLFDIMEKEVWKKASDDSAGQRKFFDAHVKDYVAEERAVATLYSSGTNALLETLKSYIEKKDTVSIQKMIAAKEVRRERGSFQKTDKPVFAGINWKPGLYLTENNRMYYLVGITEILPPGLLPFEEARAEVISDYQDSLEKEFLNQLKKKYSVKINEKAKKHVLEKLQS